MTENKKYDLVIVGMGFAGYSGAIYAARYGLKTLVIGEMFGGQTTEAHEIGNYPGFEKISGMELMQKVQQQAQKLGISEDYGRVSNISKKDDLFTITYSDGQEVLSKKVLITIGMAIRKLGVPGEKELYGKGITYCATCDGYFFKGKKVAVIGGGDAAVSAALFLADLTTEVHMIVRKDKVRAEKFWLDKLEARENVHIHYNAVVDSFIGTEKLEKINLKEEKGDIEVDGAFIEIGHIPHAWFTDALGVKTDNRGFIDVDNDQQTSIEGAFAAGDCTNASNHFAQLLTAAAEAAIAVEAIARKI